MYHLGQINYRFSIALLLILYFEPLLYYLSLDYRFNRSFCSACMYSPSLFFFFFLFLLCIQI